MSTHSRKPDDGTTRVTHAYEFDFRTLFGWVERRIAEPLRIEIEHEVARLAEILGHATDAGTISPT